MAEYACKVCGEPCEPVRVIEGKKCAYCQDCDIWFRADKPIETGPIKATMYAHRSKESNRDLASELGLPENISSEFAYALSEVVFDVEIDRRTGITTILSVNGSPLVKPVVG